MFVSLIISTIWSIYLGLHLLPLLQLNVPDEFRDRQAVARGWWHLAISQVLVLFLLVCYCRAMLTAPGSVPDTPAWKLGAQEASSDIFVPLTQEVKNSGERRHCKWCLKFKPDRCHHCRVCKMCILRMDHHCPWIYNCVGFRNHKYFFLLLLYAAIDCHLITWTMLESVKNSVDSNTPFVKMFLLLFGETLAAFLGILVTVFFGFHIWLMVKAMTTIEFCEKSMKKTGYNSSVYDHGLLGNMQQVLGDNPLLWLLPCSPPSGKGLFFTKEMETGRGHQKKAHHRSSYGSSKRHSSGRSRRSACAGSTSPPSSGPSAGEATLLLPRGADQC